MAEQSSEGGSECVEDGTEDGGEGKDPASSKKARKVKVVQLPDVRETLTRISAHEEVVVVPVGASRPFAILLRLRVTQIVSGIITVLLGSVACLDVATRLTLGMGIPSGILIVFSAAAHIQATKREYQSTVVYSTATDPTFVTSMAERMRFHTPLDALKPLLPTLACVLACLLLLTLSFMAAASSDSNLRALGGIQAVCTLVVLTTECSVWTYRWHWVSRIQVT